MRELETQGAARRAARAGRWALVGPIALSISACITVNIYFPAPEVRRAAEEIVEETWGGPPAHRSEEATPVKAGGDAWLLRAFVDRAYAQEPDINVSTAAIRALKAAMAARAEELKPYLNKGRLGINREGMLEIRSLEGLPLREQASVRRLVEAENGDRMALYREIAKANDFGEDRVADIKRIFAEVWIEKAEKGWWVQKSSGSWVQKD